jgi:O-antigen ligase
MNNAAQFGSTANIRKGRSLVKPSLAATAEALPRDVVGASLTERILTACALVLSTGAFVDLFPGQQGLEHAEEGLLFAQGLWSILYGTLFWLNRTKIWAFARLIWQNRLLFLLLAWAFASIVWSIDRQVTLRHLIALLATTFFGVYLGLRYSLSERLRLVLTSLGVVVSTSALACIVFPKYAVRADNITEQPAWQGVLGHKNALGRLGVLTALILMLYFIKRIKRVQIVGLILFLFIVVVLTQAKTSLVYFILGIVAFALVRNYQKSVVSRTRILSLAAILFGGLGAWLFYNWAIFVESLGKDPLLTGRISLWILSVRWILERPLLGFGFDAFWFDFYGPAAEFRAASGWLEAPNAHNGIINLWLDLGLIGVVLFIAVFASSYRAALVLAKTSRNAQALWPLVFLTFLFLYSLTEISFLTRNDFIWMLFMSVVIGLKCPFPTLIGKGTLQLSGPVQ